MSEVRLLHLSPRYVLPHPILLSSPSIPPQNLSHCSNIVNDGSPSRIRIVRRISLGITTRPRSSMRRTIPVAFILDSSRICRAGARRVYCIALENMDSIRRSWEGMQIFGWICFPARGRNFHQNRPPAGYCRQAVLDRQKSCVATFLTCRHRSALQKMLSGSLSHFFAAGRKASLLTRFFSNSPEFPPRWYPASPWA